MVTVAYFEIWYSEGRPGSTNTAWTLLQRKEFSLLEMGCTVANLMPGRKYFFIVRGVGSQGQLGPWCAPQEITL